MDRTVFAEECRTGDSADTCSPGVLALSNCDDGTCFDPNPCCMPGSSPDDICYDGDAYGSGCVAGKDFGVGCNTGSSANQCSQGEGPTVVCYDGAAPL